MRQDTRPCNKLGTRVRYHGGGGLEAAMLACLPMVCQATRSTGESGRTSRNTDAKAWVRRGPRRAKRAWGGV